jgi:hypothetical protein
MAFFGFHYNIGIPFDCYLQKLHSQIAADGGATGLW